MARLAKENVHMVEIDGKFALIDQTSGKIHIVDAANAKAWEDGEELEFLSSDIALQVSGGSGIPDEYSEEDEEDEEI